LEDGKLPIIWIISVQFDKMPHAKPENIKCKEKEL